MRAERAPKLIWDWPRYMPKTSLIEILRGPLIICVAVFFAGWVKFLFDGDVTYFLDYGFRLVCLAIVFRHLGWREVLTLPRNPIHAFLWVAVIFYIAVALQQSEQWARFYLPDFRLAGFAPLDAGALRFFDLSMGLAIVALSEELVFRRLFNDLWRAASWSTLSLYVASSLAFGLLHLPRGAILAVSAMAFGGLMMALFRQTGSIWPPVIVHYAVNFLIFSGIGCNWGMGGCLPP